MAQGRLVKVILSNRTTLLNGFKGPDFSAISLTPEEILKNIDEVKPTPIFKYASNIVRAITRDEVLGLLKLTAEVSEVVEEKPTVAEPVSEEKKDEEGNTTPPIDAEASNPEPTEVAVDTVIVEDEKVDVQEDTDGNVELPAPVTPVNNTQFKKNKR